jgi:hypothetical protein
MDEWLERYAGELGVPSIDADTARAVLGLAREVAHGVERRLAPLCAYLVGLHVAGQAEHGVDRTQAVREALDTARSMLPPSGSAGDRW